MLLLGWFSNRRGRHFTTGKRAERTTRLPVPNLPLSHWSSQLFDLRAPLSTDVAVLLLSQPSREKSKGKGLFSFLFSQNGWQWNQFITRIPQFDFLDMLRTVHVIRSTWWYNQQIEKCQKTGIIHGVTLYSGISIFLEPLHNHCTGTMWSIKYNQTPSMRTVRDHWKCRY